MAQTIKQIKVFISCPSDVLKEKDIVEGVCKNLSKIFLKKNIHIKPIHWKKNVVPIVTGERPQDIINEHLKREDYDIYIGILWKRFGDPQENGLTPTEEEFENALREYNKKGRPLITVFFKEEPFYSHNEYETNQFLGVQRFKNRIESLGLYDTFATELEFQGKTFVCIQNFIEKLITVKDNQVFFERIKYPEVDSYIPRKVCPTDKYKPDELWFLDDRYKKDVINLLKVKNRIALIGDAGSGKTFELERIANHFSVENAPFYPLLIRLNTFTNQSIEEILPAGWERIPENQLLIILDGLDEIESKNKKDAIRKIEHFSAQHPSSIIIASCRTNFYQTETNQTSGTLNGFESYRLLDLEYDQIRSYVEHRLSAGGSIFFKEIRRNQLEPLLHIPFYLVRLVELFESEKSFPDRKAVILERLFLDRVRLDEEHFRTTVDLDEYRDTIIKTLERISLAMECLGRNYISDDEFRKLIPDVSLRNLIKHCTAWKNENAERPTWQFEHNSIQEYLAARVLSRQSLDIVRDFISFEPDHKKIIPSWVNTVSFLLSISEDSNLLDWILAIEPEIFLKVEPDKIPKQTRIKIFKEIFDLHKEKKIWLDTERFRNDELARFGQSDEVIAYLLNEAESAEHITTLGNAIGILSQMLIPPDFKDRTRDLLEKVALNKFNIQVNDSIQGKALMALSHLNFDSKEMLERIVSKLRSSTSDWIRYGLYYFIHNSDFLDDFTDIFLEGIRYTRINVPSEDIARLGNERWELKEGLKKTKSPHSIIKILKYFTQNCSDLSDLFLGNHDISFLAENAANAFSEDSSVLDYAIHFLVSMLNNFQYKKAEQFIQFFERTNTKPDAFKKVLAKEAEHKEICLAYLANDQCLSFFVHEYKEGRISDDEVWRFLHSLRWKNKNLFDPFYEIINQEFRDKFKLKPAQDWERLRKERAQHDLNLIFDKQALVEEIRLIFQTEKKEVFTPEELLELRSKYLTDKYYSDLAYDTLRKVAGDKQVSMEIVEQKIETWDWDRFCISEIYTKLRTHEDLELTQEQEKWITNWCYSNLDKVDFKTAIQKTGERTFSIRWNAIFLWYFFRRFNLQYPKNILLDMLLFDYEGIGIEYLENYLDEKEMTSRILENLHEGIVIDDVLKNHIEYCERHKVKQVIKYASTEITNHKRDPHDEIRRISLETVSELSEDLSELEEILPDVKDEFKWQLIDELIKRKSQRVLPFLKELFEKSNDEDRIKASEYLIKYQDLNALRFYVDWIKEQKEFSRTSYDSSPLRFLKTTEAIPILLDLLAMSYEGIIQQADRLERLDRLVLDGLTTVALESDANYLEVKQSMESFIEKYSSIYQNVNWLNAFLDQLEKKYYVNKTEKLEIGDVIKKLESVNF